MKVFIPAHDIHPYLSELTKHTHKSMIRVGKKPILSYIIESYPKDSEFIIPVGHKAKHIVDFLELSYPNIKFNLINIEDDNGLYNLLSVLDKIKKTLAGSPFIFHSCSTIFFKQKLPSLKENWSLNSRKGRKSNHIGIFGVKDVDLFWNIIENIYREENIFNLRMDSNNVIDDLIRFGFPIKTYSVNSHFIINDEKSLLKARSNIKDRFDNLDKVDESIFFFDDFVIKFFADEDKIKNRVERAKVLGHTVPKMEQVRSNFYKYKYVEGGLYSHVASSSDIENIMNWARKNLWKPVKEVSDTRFQEICLDFYRDKTIKRVERLFSSRKIKDRPLIINNVKIPAFSDLIKKVDFEWLQRGFQTNFHGDFILENIIKTDDGYCLLDWRQDFGGLLKGGDMYYDLAKFMHNLIVNHEVISDKGFQVKIKNNSVICKIKRKKHLVECEESFIDFLKKEGLDYKKVKVLSSIIWLNMSPLHDSGFDLFLFYYGMYNLYVSLNKKYEELYNRR